MRMPSKLAGPAPTIEKRFGSETAAVQVTEITYLSSASPQAIATFYANTLPEDGWRRGTGLVHPSIRVVSL